MHPQVRAGSKTLWSIAGPQGDAWNSVHIALGEVSSFSFIASRGTSYTGDIAVDAIEIKCAIAVSVAPAACCPLSPVLSTRTHTHTHMKLKHTHEAQTYT